MNLEHKVTILDENPNAGMVYSDPKLINAYGEHIPSERPTNLPHGHVFREFLRHNRIITFSSTLIRKNILEKVGLLDQRKAVMTCDDYDLWLKIADICEVEYSPDRDVFYRIHNNNLLRNLDQNLQAHMYVFKEALKQRQSISLIPRRELLGIILQHLYERYHHFAYKYYYDNRDYKKSFTLLLRCVALKPSILYNWKYLIICSLPSNLIELLREIKNKKKQ